MIDHMSIQVVDYGKSRAFYLSALGALGYQVVMEFDRNQAREALSDAPSLMVGGLGEGGKPDFWLAQADAASSPTHLAFRAASRAAVDAFHKAAVAAGGKDNGAPGVRAHYHPNYYGAFVVDINGHNLEAVCHDPA